MSVLTSPRIHFVGTMSWDPGLANNNAGLFDAKNVEVILPEGVTDETFPAFLIENLDRAGIWNLYGSHDAKFEQYPPGPNASNHTRVTGGRVRESGPLVETDPLIGKGLSLRGKLVDLDPRAVWNSQIFFDRFTVGDSRVGLTAHRFRTMHSRWINFRRNLDRLDIAGSAGVIWQTVFPTDHIEFHGANRSPLVNALKSVLDASGTSAQGLMLRFATYRTLYFQNGLLNQQENQPRNVQELKRLHQEGKFFSNPAYSRVVGSIGIWNRGEPTTWPAGRFLAPAGALPAIAVGGTPISFGPAVAEVVSSSNRVVLDLLHAIPEVNRNLDKANVGNLTIAVQTDEGVVELGQITPPEYCREAYERNAGIVEIPVSLTAWLQSRLDHGQLVVFGNTPNGQVPLLVEQPLQVVAEKRDWYLHHGETTEIPIRIFERGQVPFQPTKVVVGRYEGLTRTTDALLVLDVNFDGLATLPLQSGLLGASDYGMQAFRADSATPELPTDLDITAGQFVSTRTLPTDTELEQATTDTQLTWKFIYQTILRNWELMNPVMALRGFPLHDETVITMVSALLREVIAFELHESGRYMPVTRDLSKGKRRLLERWADLQ